MSDKFQAFASVVYVKMREGIFTGEEHLKHPIDLVDLRALAERDLELRKAKVEIEELRKQRNELAQDIDPEDDCFDLDDEIEAKKAEVK